MQVVTTIMAHYMGGVYNTKDKLGNASSAYYFDGINGYISVPNKAILNPTKQITIALWVRLDSITGWVPLLTKSSTDNSGCPDPNSYSVYLDPSQAFFLYDALSCSTGNSVLPLTKIPKGSWQFFVGIIDVSKLQKTIYLNGVFKAQYKDSNIRLDTTSEEMRIGWTTETHSGYSYFHGAMDEIRLYNRALSATEIKQLYQINQPPVTTTIKNIWLNLDKVLGNCYGETLRGQYDCLKPRLSYSTLQQALPFRIFLSGSHTNSALRLGSQKSFGYYNPKFVEWLIQYAVIGQNNAVLRASLQPLYQQYLQQHVRTYYLAYKYKQKYPEYYNQVQQNYLASLPNASWNNDSMYNILHPAFESFGSSMNQQGYSWTESSFAGGFWIRRSIDKTDTLFFKLVETLLNTYDKSFITP